jgi:hypothetical protein
VRVITADKSQIAEAHSGRGYQSHFGSRLHFGLGPQERVDRIEVRWPNGIQHEYAGSAANELRVLKEGAGKSR